MKVFDLHCDTASRLYETGESLLQNDGQLDLERGKGFDRWVQTFAFFVDDLLPPEEGWALYRQQYRYFVEQLKKHQLPRYPTTAQRSALLSIEGGGIVGKDLSRIATLKEDGIVLFSFTWNHDNQLAGGALGQQGLTAFGKTVLQELERQHILVDVSHLNRQSFFDVLSVSTMPLLATHSNADACCPHPRNLTDEQLLALKQHGGIVGVNFYPPFVNGGSDYPLSVLAKHIEHIATILGDSAVCLGSDFDGADMPNALFSVKQLEKCYEFMVEWFGKQFTDGLFFSNATSFFERYDGLQQG